MIRISKCNKFLSLRSFVIFLLMIVLWAWQSETANAESREENSTTFKASWEEGTQFIFIVTKTGSNTGTVKEKKWRKGKNPAIDEPDHVKTTRIYDIKTKRDGTKLVGKADVVLKDPTVIFTLNRPEKGVPEISNEHPTITMDVRGTTFGLKDKTRIFFFMEERLGNLQVFLKKANFPPINQRPQPDTTP